MVTRFSASEARLKAENAQKVLEEQRLRDKVLRKQIAKERAFVREGFEKQRETIISAAIDGKSEIEVESIFLFRELVDVGVQVVEDGLVKKQLVVTGRVVGVDELKEEILQLFDMFIDAAKGDLKSYYDGFQRFHRLNYDALYEALNSSWSWSEFYGDEIYAEEVPDELRSKYSDYIERINEKVRAYKGAFEDDDAYEDEDQLITGEYLFSDEDEDMDVLKPSVEGNKLKIRWFAEEGGTFMNDPLLSDVGLAWLSTYRGQNLIEEVFESLSNAAEMGKSTLKLDFSLSKDGWYFLTGGRKVFSCMPDELVEIISRENFTIDDTVSTQKSYAIKVSW
jgi:hypothetical protein